MPQTARTGRTTVLVGLLVGGALALLVGLLVLVGPEDRPGTGAGETGTGDSTGEVPAAGPGAGSGGGAGDRRAAQGDPADGGEGPSASRTGSLEAQRQSVAAGGDVGLPRVPFAGTVVDASSEAPVAGARVVLADPGRSVEAESDGEGRFELSWFEGAPADLAVEHPRYVDMNVAEVDLQSPGSFRLQRSARILGRLEPAPEEAGTVALAWHQATSSHRYWSEYSGEVQADGSFVIEDLDPGQYAVSARVTEGSVPIEYGLQLEPGDELDVRLELMEGSVLFGAVKRGAAFEPAPGVEIQLRPGGKRLPPMLEELRTWSVVSGPDGGYELPGLIPGNYRFTLTAEEGDIKRGSLDIAADGLRVERDFQLPGPAQLGGRVVDHDGKAVSGARVVAFAMGDTQRTLGARTGVFDEDTPETRAGADGEFILERAPTMRVLVVLAYAPGFDSTREASVAPGSVVLKQLQPGELRTGIVIQIPPGERIVGTVRSTEGETLSGVTVSAQRYFGERYVSLGIVETDSDGHYELHPLLPGRYRVLATIDHHWTEVEETEVDGGIEAEVDIVLEPMESVRGIARDAEGAGIPNLPIRLRLDEPEAMAVVEEEVVEIQRPTTVYGRTDEFGRFEVDELYPGTWTAFSSSFGWELTAVDPERLLVPTDSYVELTLEPRARRERFTITGVVELAGGGIPTGLKIEGLRGGFLEIDGGEFKASGLTPTRHNLQIGCEGHARTFVRRIDAVPGGTVDLGRIELWPSTQITVKLARKDGGEPPDDAKVSLEFVPEAEGGSPLARRLVLASIGEGRYRTNQATRHAWILRVRHEDYRNVSQRLEVKDKPKMSREIELR